MMKLALIAELLAAAGYKPADHAAGYKPALHGKFALVAGWKPAPRELICTLNACVSETASTAFSAVERIDALPFGLLVTSNNELRNAVAIGNGKGFV